MTTTRFDMVDRLMFQAVEKGVFPGGVLLVARDGAVQFLEAYGYRNLFTRQVVTTDTVFDLASLTKPLATTAALMVLVQQSELALDEPIGAHHRWLKGTALENIAIRALLNHSAGLPAYRPFYRDLEQVAPAGRAGALKQALAGISLEGGNGEQTVYSDLGFMLLGLLVEELTKLPLDRHVHETIFAPLGVGRQSEPRLYFSRPPTPPAALPENVAATEICSWRNRLLEGVVHDENAFVMDGVAGHAGLFGDALGVFAVAQSIFDAYSAGSEQRLFDTETVREFLRRNDHAPRPLGFDVPSGPDASCGQHFSERSVGHLGYTGTSLWMDLNDAVIVVLLTNRVHPSRLNERIRMFRPALHDAIMEAFFLVKTV